MRSYLLIALFSVVSRAAPNYTIPADRCVSPDGYNACQNQVNAETLSCQNNANGDQDTILGCAQAATQFSLNCVYENCWNIVYSCEVQELASLVAQNGGAAGLPYYPSPDDAPGRCSCNLEAVEEVVVGSLAALGPCTNSNSSLDGCECCAQAGAYAGLYSICPSVDPQIILQTLPGIDTLLGTYTPQFADCGQTLQQANCVMDLGYPDFGSSLTYLSAMPSSTGTESYSDLSGTLSAPTESVLAYTPISGLTVTATAVGASDNGGSGGSMSMTSASGASSSPPTASTTTTMSGGSSGTSAAAASSNTSGSASGREGSAASVVALLALLAVL